MTGLDLGDRMRQWDEQKPQSVTDKMAAWDAKKKTGASPEEVFPGWQRQQVDSRKALATTTSAVTGAGDAVLGTVGNILNEAWWMLNPFEKDQSAVTKAVSGKETVGLGDVMDLWHGKETGEEFYRAQQEASGFAGQVANVAGGVLGTLAGPGGAALGVGTKAGLRAAEPVQRGIARALAGSGMSAEKALELLKAGKLTGEAAKIAGWSQPARVAAKIMESGGRALPTVAGTAGGFGLMNYVTTGPDDRIDAMMHGVLMAPAFAGLSALGGRLETLINKRMVAEADQELVLNAVNQLRSPTSKDALKAAIEALPSTAKLLPGKAAAGAFEGLGFTAIEPEMWDTMLDAYSGDPDAQAQLAANVLGSMGGFITLKAGHLTDPAKTWSEYRRTTPELNTLETRLQAKAAKEAAEAQEQSIVSSEGAMAEGIGRQREDIKQGIPEAQAATRQQQQTEYRMGQNYPVLDQASRPLLGSGWEVRDLRNLAINNELDLRFGGRDQIRMRQNIGAEVGQPFVDLEIPGEVYNAVLGRSQSDLQKVTLTGQAAAEFIGMATLRGHTVRAAAELGFANRGFEELNSSAIWHDGSFKTLYTVGLDGKVYERSARNPGEWIPSQIDLSQPTGEPRTGVRVVQTRNGPIEVPTVEGATPALDGWAAMFRDMRAIQPRDLTDGVFANAIQLAMRGPKTSKSAEALREFFEAVDPQIIAGALTPRSAILLANGIGQIASGHQTAEGLINQLQLKGLGKPVPPPSETRQLEWSDPTQFQDVVNESWQRTPKEITPESGLTEPQFSVISEWMAPGRPSETKMEAQDAPGQAIAGQRDWRQATDAERLQGARDYAQAEADAGREPDARRLREVFGVDPKTAKKYSAAEPTSEKVKSELADIEAEIPKGPTSERTGDRLDTLTRYLNKAVEGGVEVDIKAVADKFGVKSRTVFDIANEIRRKREGGFLFTGETADKPFRSGKFGAGRKVAETVASYYERLPDMLRRLGAGEFGDKADVAAFETRRFKNAAAKLLKKAVKAARKKVSGVRIKEILDSAEIDEQGNKNYLFRDLVEGRRPLEEQPQDVQDVVLAARKYIDTLWQQGREANVVRPNRETGEPELFGEGTGGKTLPRYMGEDRAEVLADPELRQHYTEVLAKGNNVPVETVEAWMKSQPDVKSLAPDKEAAFENPRWMKYAPDVITYKGRDYEVQSGKMLDTLERMLEEQPGRSGVVKAFGPDVNDAFREKHGLDPSKKGVQAEYQKILDTLTNEKGNTLSGFASTSPAHRAWTAIMSLQGRTTGEPSIFGKEVPRAYQGFERLRRALRVVKAPAYDLFDAIRALPHMAGYWNSMMGMARLLGRPMGWKAALEDAFDAGVILRDVGDYALMEAKGTMAKLGDLVSTPGRATEKLKQLAADMTAKYLLGRWSRGKVGTLVAMRLKNLGLSDADIAALTSGRSDTNLQQRFREKFVSQATSNFVRGEGSYAHQSKQFNFHIPFNRFFMGQLAHTARYLGQLNVPGKRANAIHGLLSMAVGSAISGFMVSPIMYMLSGRSFDQWKRDVADNPGLFIARYGAQQMFGGILAQGTSAVIDAIKQDGFYGLVTKTWAPGQVPMELFDAVGGHGSYASDTPLERLATLAHRLPLVPGGANAFYGLASEPVQKAVTNANRWMRENGVSMPRYSAGSDNDLWFPMEQVEKAIKRSIETNGKIEDDSEIKARLQEALGAGTGKEIASALRARKLLQPGQLDDKQLAGVVANLGDEQVGLIRAYNESLETLAKDYAKEPGTPEPQDAFTARLERVKEQVGKGFHERWRELVDEAVGAEVVAQETHSGSVALELEDLASAMAAYPESLGKYFSEDEVRALQKRGLFSRASMIELILRRRAVERRRDKKREEIKARREQR